VPERYTAVSAGAPVPDGGGTHGRLADTSVAPGAQRAPVAPPGRLYRPPEGDGEGEGEGEGDDDGFVEGDADDEGVEGSPARMPTSLTESARA
jgi:hypothetical protein